MAWSAFSHGTHRIQDAAWPGRHSRGVRMLRGTVIGCCVAPSSKPDRPGRAAGTARSESDAGIRINLFADRPGRAAMTLIGAEDRAGLLGLRRPGRQLLGSYPEGVLRIRAISPRPVRLRTGRGCWAGRTCAHVPGR